MEIGKRIRPGKELVDGFCKLGTSTIGNVLDDLKIPGIINNIKPVCPGFHFAGAALTVKEVTGVLGAYTNEDFTLGQVIDSAQEGDVIVFDNSGHMVSTWGGIASLAAQKNGVRATVIDGGVRDIDEIRAFDFPVFSKHVVPTSAKGRIKIIGMNIEIKMDQTTVRPGDIIVGDGTGVVCVPMEIAEEVLKEAIRLDKQDKQAMEDIRNGMGFAEALQKYRKL